MTVKSLDLHLIENPWHKSLTKAKKVNKTEEELIKMTGEQCERLVMY